MSAKGKPRQSLADVAEVDAVDWEWIAGSGAKDPDLLLRRLEKVRAEGRLIDFFRLSWPEFDSHKLSLNWHHECIAEHLEAVVRGEILRLLINIPPRCSKTTLVTICLPAWIWLQRDLDFLRGPQVKFLCTSYGKTPVERQASVARNLLLGKWYQEFWGDRVKIIKDGLGQIENAAGGYRISESLGGAVLGAGGDLIIVDDPEDVESAESTIERERTLRLFSEGLTTRRTIPSKTATIVVMQRLHEDDVSGYILENDHGYEHLMLPMRFDSRRFVESKWYSDPRVEDGELLWPEQFPAVTVDGDEGRLAEYAFAGQYQQTPIGRGGNVIKRAWWRLWPDDAPEMAERSSVWWCPSCNWSGMVYADAFGAGCPRCGALAEKKVIYPQFSFQMLSVDTAYGEKEENSWSALTGWGIWHGKDEAPRAMLTTAWRGRPKLRADPETREMGLVERVYDVATRRQVDLVLIEKKTRGVDLYQEIERLTTTWPFRLEYWDPTGRGDKVARLHSVAPLFTNDLVWAPNKSWAETVIGEVSAQPRAKFSDLSDTMSSALIYLRQSNMLNLVDEHRREVRRELVMAGTKPFDVSEEFEGV
jgi:phage terminase large subunit-like protein